LDRLAIRHKSCASVEIQYRVITSSGGSVSERFDCFNPGVYQSYYNAYLHQDCWGYVDDTLYTRILHTSPPMGLKVFDSQGTFCNGKAMA